MTLLLEAPQTATDTGRAIPSALDAERSVLSSMIQDPADRIGQAVEAGLGAEHFYLSSHALIYRLLLELYDADKPIDVVILCQLLTDRKQIDAIGGPSALVDLSRSASSAAHFDYYLTIIRDKFSLRGAIKACSEGLAEAYANPPSADDFLDGLETQIFAVKQARETQSEQTVAQLMDGAIKNLEDLLMGKKKMEGLSSGYPELDAMSGGLKPSEMLIIAARPSMGKTSFMMNIVEHVVCDLHQPALVFSCEMASEQIVQRLLFSRGRFNMAAVQRGIKPTKGELKQVMQASQDISTAPLFLDDTPSLPIGDLRAKARRMKRDHDIQLIAVDYLQLMRSKSKQANDSREREVAEISAGLKAIAKELKIPVIVLAQLNRGPEQRQGGAPRMSDLRESGSIEQDADLIGLLYREEYYNDPTADDAAEQKEANEGKAQLIIAKNRNGATGDVPLTFRKELMRFETRAFEPENN
ncbi:replicative DNA helicase [Roseibacillus persicicus]|uniref:replicative DNA helicase n=1 Tax=Roseibacillus persicicus TaxID=454148 RepID=UPI00398B2CAC